MDFKISISEALCKHLERTKFVKGIGTLKESSKDVYLYGSIYRKAVNPTGNLCYHTRPNLKDAFLCISPGQTGLELVVNEINEMVNIFHFKPIFKTQPVKCSISIKGL